MDRVSLAAIPIQFSDPARICYVQQMTNILYIFHADTPYTRTHLVGVSCFWHMNGIQMANGWTRTRTHSPLIRVAANDNDITTVAIFFLRSYQPSAVCVWQSHRFYRKRSFWCYAVGPLSVSFISVAVVGFVVYLSFCWLGRSLSLAGIFSARVCLLLLSTSLRWSCFCRLFSALARSLLYVHVFHSAFSPFYSLSCCHWKMTLTPTPPSLQINNSIATGNSNVPSAHNVSLTQAFLSPFFSSNRLLLADKVTRLNGK